MKLDLPYLQPSRVNDFYKQNFPLLIRYNILNNSNFNQNILQSRTRKYFNHLQVYRNTRLKIIHISKQAEFFIAAILRKSAKLKYSLPPSPTYRYTYSQTNTVKSITHTSELISVLTSKLCKFIGETVNLTRRNSHSMCRECEQFYTTYT